MGRRKGVKRYKYFSSRKSREVLELENDFIFDIPSNGCFPNLKVLNVNIRNPDCEFLNGLFRSCPVLEILSLYGTSLGHGVKYIFRICIPTLKRLEVSLIDDNFQYCWRHKFIIKTPNLESLTISDDSLASFMIDEIPSTLSEATLSIGYSHFVHTVEVSKDEARRVMETLKGIRNAKTLTLSPSTSSALGYSFDGDFPTFPFLMRLVLGIDHYFGWKLLPHFLQSSPVLNFLALERESEEVFFTAVGEGTVDEPDEDDTTFGWIPPKPVPDCLMQELEEIRMSNLWRYEDEVAVVKYLLENGKVLKKMSFNFDEATFGEELNKDMIENFPRGSDKCELEFV